MKHFLLFIRETGNEDVTDFYPDEASARKALAEYVRSRISNEGRLCHRLDDEVIADYFQGDQALYAIACVGRPC